MRNFAAVTPAPAEHAGGAHVALDVCAGRKRSGLETGEAWSGFPSVADTKSDVCATRVTPAMEAGLSNHVWTIEEMVDRVGLR